MTLDPFIADKTEREGASIRPVHEYNYGFIDYHRLRVRKENASYTLTSTHRRDTVHMEA